MRLMYCSSCCHREWIQALWQWLGTRAQHLHLLTTCPYPLLPVKRGQLVKVNPLSTSAVVAPEPDWPQGLGELLQQLGCHLLDVESFELPLGELLGKYVHRGDGMGVVAALTVALGGGPLPEMAATKQDRVGGVRGVGSGSSISGGRRGPFLMQDDPSLASAAAAAVAAAGGLFDRVAGSIAAAGAATSTAGGSSHGSGSSREIEEAVAVARRLRVGRVEAVGTEAKHLLRSFLLQERWFRGMGPGSGTAAAAGGDGGSLWMVQVLKALPIYPVAATVAAQEQSEAAAAEAHILPAAAAAAAAEEQLPAAGAAAAGSIDGGRELTAAVAGGVCIAITADTALAPEGNKGGRELGRLTGNWIRTQPSSMFYNCIENCGDLASVVSQHFTPWCALGGQRVSL